mmetsp:Transcript_2473/g.7418  ORF Transcript_2473/g.7418 Transcript_2473/m.7418 type:complete len:157 (-) Transcript_2473:2557-3027(-)
MQAAAGRVCQLQRHLTRIPRQELGRQASSINYDVGDSDVEALLHENLVKQVWKKSEESDPRLILTTSKDAIQLYRDIWRYSRLFVWVNEQGIPWRDVIRESARKEYEQARFETDHSVITRLLVVGRDAVMQAKDKFMEQREKIQREEAANAPRPNF